MHVVRGLLGEYTFQAPLSENFFWVHPPLVIASMARMSPTKFVLCGPCGSSNPNASGIPVDEDGNELIGSPRSADRSPRLCYYFTRGICNRGEQCRFSHDINASIDDPTSIEMKPVHCEKWDKCTSQYCQYLHPWSKGTRDALFYFNEEESAASAVKLLAGMSYKDYTLVAYQLKYNTLTVKIKYLNCKVTDVDMVDHFYNLFNVHGIFDVTHKLYSRVDTTDCTLSSSVSSSSVASPQIVSTVSTPLATPKDKPMNYLASVKGVVEDVDKKVLEEKNATDKTTKNDMKDDDDEYHKKRQEIMNQLEELEMKKEVKDQTKHILDSGEGIFSNGEKIQYFAYLPVLVLEKSGVASQDNVYDELFNGIMEARKELKTRKLTTK